MPDLTVDPTEAGLRLHAFAKRGQAGSVCVVVCERVLGQWPAARGLACAAMTRTEAREPNTPTAHGHELEHALDHDHAHAPGLGRRERASG